MRRPYVILVSAITVDGRIASRTGYSKLSCPHDLTRLHELRSRVDAIMVGANTVIADDPKLTVRYVRSDRQPIRIVVDGMLRAPVTAKVFDVRIARTILITSERADAKKIGEIVKRGVEVMVFKEYPIRLRDVMERLYEIGIRRVLVEGGGSLNWSLAKEDLIDEMYLTVTPYIFGSGRSVFEGLNEGFSTTDESPRLKLVDVKICECQNEVVLHYLVQR